MKRYGIRITLPQGNTLSAPHLLGENWESFRWFATEQDRDLALSNMSRDLPNYRKGDRAAPVLTAIEREEA